MVHWQADPVSLTRTVTVSSIVTTVPSVSASASGPSSPSVPTANVLTTSYCGTHSRPTILTTLGSLLDPSSMTHTVPTLIRQPKPSHTDFCETVGDMVLSVQVPTLQTCMGSDVRVSLVFDNADKAKKWRQRLNHSAEDLGVSLRLHMVYYQNRTGTGGNLRCDVLSSRECVGGLRQVLLLVDSVTREVDKSQSVVDVLGHIVVDPGSSAYVFVVEVKAYQDAVH